MNAPAPHGPYATADAIETIKHRSRLYDRMILAWEIGDRAFSHAVEVTR
jgi:hypothetical protein